MINDVKRRRPNRTKTHLPADVRYVLSVVRHEKGWPSDSQAIREAVMLGLRQLGWTTRRIRSAYLRYALDCEENGKPNQFSSKTRG